MIQLDAARPVHFCDGLTRRDFLHAGALVSGSRCSGPLRAEGLRRPQTETDVNCIMLFLVGGPSQLDTWDMKPDAPAEIRGPFKPIETNVPGIQICEIFPRMAKHADKFSLVRWCYHTAAAVHDTGHQMMQTGRLFTGGIEHPHVGCVLGYLQGPRRATCRPHVLLPRPIGHTGGNMPHGQNAGFLGKTLRSVRPQRRPVRRRTSRCPTCCRRTTSPRCGSTAAASCARSSTARSSSSRRAPDARLLDATSTRPTADVVAEGPRGVRPVAGAGRGARALRPEPLRPVLPAGPAADRSGRAVRHGQHVRDGLQRDHLGHPRLGAVHPIEGYRRPGGPDVRPGLQRRCSKTCSQRGLLENTLVVAMGEFGRTPKINPAGGRDHWPQCWTMLIAGGGVKGGQVVGSIGRDRRLPGGPAGRRRREVAATIYHGLGLDLETELPGPQGRPIPAGGLRRRADQGAVLDGCRSAGRRRLRRRDPRLAPTLARAAGVIDPSARSAAACWRETVCSPAGCCGSGRRRAAWCHEARGRDRRATCGR